MPVLKLPAERHRQGAPRREGGEDADGQDERKQEEAGHDALDHGGEPEPGQEAEDHARAGPP